MAAAVVIDEDDGTRWREWRLWEDDEGNNVLLALESVFPLKVIVDEDNHFPA